MCGKGSLLLMKPELMGRFWKSHSLLCVDLFFVLAIGDEISKYSMTLFNLNYCNKQVELLTGRPGISLRAEGKNNRSLCSITM